MARFTRFFMALLVASAVAVVSVPVAEVSGVPMSLNACLDAGGTLGALIDDTPGGGNNIHECTFPGQSTGPGSGNDPCAGAIFSVDCSGNSGEGIFEVLDIVLNVLTAGVGVAAAVGIVVAAIRYTQARDKVESVTGAKKMIVNIMIGLAVWALFYALMRWLLPGVT
ncbi:hypothetical protein FWG76_01360 [Candidatus Saccharibacteria bacterium]|nr:hypothetical protein [Candidatus Saccharibacteria bacterium]